ncbi:MAG: AtpZ/AtpI family protein [Sphingomonas sp.]
MADEQPGQDPSPQDARLASLDARLNRAQAGEAAKNAAFAGTPGKGQAQGMRILSVLFGYPLGSAAIGWVVDQVAHTHWIAVVMLFVGFGAAIWEVYKISQQRPE